MQRWRLLQSLQMRTPESAKRRSPATTKASVAARAPCYPALRPCFSATRDAHCPATRATSLRGELLHPQASLLRSLAEVRSARIGPRVSSVLLSSLPVADLLPHLATHHLQHNRDPVAHRWVRACS